MKSRIIIAILLIAGSLSFGITFATCGSGTTSTTNPFCPPYKLEDSSNGNAVRMYVDSSGNVGIGTTSPSQKLDVNGDLALEGSYGGTIHNIWGPIGIGNVNTGWYSDGNNLAARIPSSSGGFYVQNSGGTTTYMKVLESGSSTELFGNTTIDGNIIIPNTGQSIVAHNGLCIGYC